jgi:aquaporin Z
VTGHPRAADDDAAAASRRRNGVRIAELLERQPPSAQDFTDLSQEWRRLFAELFGTFLLVTAGAGAAVRDCGRHLPATGRRHGGCVEGSG